MKLVIYTYIACKLLHPCCICILLLVVAYNIALVSGGYETIREDDSPGEALWQERYRRSVLLL